MRASTLLSLTLCSSFMIVGGLQATPPKPASPKSPSDAPPVPPAVTEAKPTPQPAKNDPAPIPAPPSPPAPKPPVPAPPPTVDAPPSPSDLVDNASIQVTFAPPDGRTIPLVFLPSVEVVVDSSHSMKSPLNGHTKLDVARQAAEQFLRDLPDQVPVGLRLFGHWGIWIARRQNPSAPSLPVSDDRLLRDTQLVVPIGPLSYGQREKLQKWLNWTQPRGETPLQHSLTEAIRDLQPMVASTKAIVLLSDGVESVDGIGSFREGQIPIHVVPIGADMVGERRLREIASASGGTLSEPTDIGRLRTLLGTIPTEVSFELLDESQQVVATHKVNGKPIPVPAGKYRVRIAGQRSGLATVELLPRRAVEVQLDDAARMLVKAAK